ncbi:MAG: tol-pal system-associated acyl-CoA thioesterase [Alphaproteobacteria bacterium]
MKTHSIPIRIYYEDTDAGGITYHANYIRFGERGRTEFLRDCGFTNSGVRDEMGVFFVVKHIEVEYHKPTRLDDLLRMDTQIETIKNTSFIMTHKIHCEKTKDLTAELRVILVCVDTNTLKPVRMPAAIKAKFEEGLTS